MNIRNRKASGVKSWDNFFSSFNCVSLLTCVFIDDAILTKLL